MWQRHKLIVQISNDPIYGVLRSIAAAAADNRKRALLLISGSLSERRVKPAHGFVFSTRCLWLSHDGVYLFLPGCLQNVAGLRWITFSKVPMVRSGMTLAALAAIRYIHIQWSHRRSAWTVSLLSPRQTAVSADKRLYVLHEQER